MFWNWDTIGTCYISTSWYIENHGMMAATSIGTILLVVLVEFARRLGKELDGLLVRQFHHQAAAVGPRPMTVVIRASALQQMARAILHAITFGGAYIVMLLGMSFNGYIIISIFVGAGLGKFFCDWLVVRVDAGEGSWNKGIKGIEETTVCCG
ncbi:high affinity copper transporter [Grosmannia clavigera kw1407]|uniref:Copper transport protein n=1 Tax=Grosmannia clavigera (strain kw1407 / UAMH 11150) TaxID=655863 RepID=F0X6M6_GROCL|nr:high affinity copper transporter [Grosmannia clavigera kw1407]EFX06270.1 high affinity copper transporter [Grosmannia clavigera kw1407]